VVSSPDGHRSQSIAGIPDCFARAPLDPPARHGAAYAKRPEHEAFNMSAVHKVDPLEAIFRWRPALRDAVQPPALPFVNGQFSFKPEVDWAEFIAGLNDFRFRESDPRNWAGPFCSFGTCLDPFSQEHDLCYVDPTLEPRDGDFVLVAWGPRALASWQFQGARTNWIEKYGCEPGPIATKRLRRMGNDWLLCVRNSFYWLADSRVLGVMIRKERGSVELHAPASCAIDPNAATQVYAAVDDGPDSFNPSVNGDGYLSISGSGLDSASLLNGSLVIDAQIVDPVSTLAGVSLQVTWSGGSESTPSIQPQHTDRRSYSFQHSFTTLPNDTAWTMRVSMSGNADITVQRAAMRAEVIKR
jgi:hypothetical protein